MVTERQKRKNASYHTQVLNCGAGFDTTYLHLRNQSVIGPDRCRYFEVDFPAVASLKAAIVRGSRHAVSLCLTRDMKRKLLADTRGNIRIGNYSVIGCDLSGAGFKLTMTSKKYENEP